MSSSAKFELRKPIHPYICSTPRDFSEERDYLRKEVFPKLHDLCKLRGSYFNPVDLRWMPGDKNACEGLLLTTLLDAIKRCSPFFICLLGETYGPFRDENDLPLVLPKYGRRFEVVEECDWLNKNLLLAAAGNHPWVLQEGHQFKSVTELEVTLGAASSDDQYVTLYYRQSDHLEDKLSLCSGHVQERDEITSIYCSECEKARLKIHGLRQRLVNKGVPVKYFRTPEELGKLVLEDWMQIVDILLPPLMHDVKLLDTNKYTEWLAQESFISNHEAAFVETSEVGEVLQKLTDFALTFTRTDAKGQGQGISYSPSNMDKKCCNSPTDKNNKNFSGQNPAIMLLTGGRGVGKSTLVVHWLSEFKKDNPHICVISHFVTASKKSADIVYFLHQCITNLRRAYLHSETLEPSSLLGDLEAVDGDSSHSFMSLCEAFIAAIALGPCVILVDGINELSSCREFDWLPENLPTTCKLIFTTTCSDISHRCLRQRRDITLINFPTSLTDAGTTVAMIEKHIPNVTQLVGGEKVMKRLAFFKLMHTALGSRVIGSEIACFRVYSKMEAFLEAYTEMWSLREFWSQCVQGWVKTYSWKMVSHPVELQFTDSGFDYSGWVTDSLCLIAISRNGLTQTQILSILKSIGYRGHLEVTDYDWIQFQQAAGITLQELGNGCLVFGHKYLQEIAQYLFLRVIPSLSHDPEDILKSASIGRQTVYHNILAQFFSEQELSMQVLEELPWHLMLSGDITGLVNFLTNCQTLVKLLDDPVFWQRDLELFWSVCQLCGHQPDLTYIRLMHILAIMDVKDLKILEEEQENHLRVISAVEKMATSTPRLSALGFVETDQNWTSYNTSQRICKTKEPKKVSDNLQAKLSAQDNFVTQVDSDTAYQAQTFSVKQDNENLSEVPYLCWYLANFLLSIDKRKACSILFSSLINYLKQNCPVTVELHLLECRCHQMMAKLQIDDTGDITAAERECKLALHALMAAVDLDDELTYERQTLYLKGLLLNSHGDIHIYKKQLYEAEQLLKEALDCVIDASGCVVLKSAIYINMGILKLNVCDYKQAEFYLCESAKLRRQWFGHNHPLVAEVLLSLARLLATPRNIKGKNLKRAENLYRQTLSIQEKCFGSNHLLVAEVLFELGKLLSEERSRPAKLEAQKYLRQSLDIRITNLGGNHPLSAVTQQHLAKLNVALQMGNYEFGFTKPPENRSKSQPFSSLTLREYDLTMQQNRAKSSASIPLDDSGYFHSVNQERTVTTDASDKITQSLISLTSASERLLSAPIVEMPRLLQRKRESPYSQYLNQNLFKHNYNNFSKGKENFNAGVTDTLVGINGGINNNAEFILDSRIIDNNHENIGVETNIRTDSEKIAIKDSEDPVPVDAVVKDENSNLIKGNNDNQSDSPRIGSYANIIVQSNLSNKKKMVSVRSSSAPRRLFEKFQSARLPINRPQSCFTKSRSSGHSFKGHPWSGKSGSNMTSFSTNCHVSHCNIPGPHDITLGNSQTIIGPHTCLTSLLGDNPCPRPMSNKLYHRSAWYHVPGRYSTPHEHYPRKRMQRTKSAIELETLLALRSQ